jgi:hypothetical protein
MKKGELIWRIVALCSFVAGAALAIVVLFQL